MSKSWLLALLLSFLSYCLALSYFEPVAAKSIAVATLMVFLWATETLDLPVVGLFPLFLFPLLGIQNIEKTASYYSSPIMFLFLGGFIIGLAIEKSCLHQRLALFMLSKIGTSGNRILLAFILCTGFISMWISNTAATLMMLPLALSILSTLKDSKTGNLKNLETSLLLSVAYAANFGGIATLIGSPVNLLMAGYIERTYHYKIAFVDWMIIGVPTALMLLSMLFLTMIFCLPSRITQDHDLLVKKECSTKISEIELKTLLIFLTVVFFWIFGSFLQQYLPFQINDTSIAVAGAAAFFILRSNGKTILDWSDTKEIPWGILLLFGGGLALAGSLEENQVLEAFAGATNFLSDTHVMLILAIIVLFSIFISELLSNISQVIVFLPIACTIATTLNYDPLLFAIALTIAASSASMLPTGTPPNAIVFTTGKIPMRKMLQIGLLLNLLSFILITLALSFLLPLTGMQLSSLR